MKAVEMAELTKLPVGKKRKVTTSSLSTDYSKCIICQKTKGKGKSEPLQRLTEKGYDALSYAVNNRNDNIACRLVNDVNCKEEFLSKSPKCHSGCRNPYTNRKTVDQKMGANKDIDQQQESTSSRVLATRSSSCSLDFKKVCFVCEKVRGKKGDRTLVLIATKNRQRAIYCKAKELDDEQMLNKIQGHGDNCGDLIADNFRYHKGCLTSYMLKRRPVSSQTNCQSSESTDEETRAFEMLLTDIEPKLLSDSRPSVYFLCQLRDKVRNILAEISVADSYLYNSRKLAKQIRNHFGDKVVIIPQQGTASLVCSSAISMAVVLYEVKQLRGQLEEWEYLDDDDQTGGNDDHEACSGNEKPDIQRESFHVAKTIRTEVKDIERQIRIDAASSVLGKPDLDVTYDEASKLVPVDLYNHVSWMIHGVVYDTGSDGRVALSPRQHEQVLNICQDIISAMSSIPTPKQVGMALHIIKQTRSKDTVTLLNRFGNSISYYDAQRYITSMAQRADDQLSENGFFIPENIQQGLFTHFAFDNLDFHENTLDGKTTHGTTHIIYQYAENEAAKSSTYTIPLKKPRKMSLPTTDSFQTRPSMLTLKDRQKSRSLTGMKLVPEAKADDSEVARRNFIFNLCQVGSTDLLDVEDSKPTSWRQFHESMVLETEEKTIIGYGPFFPESPTNPDVIVESVNYCTAVAKQLGQDHCIITCDQAIYEIVLALQKKHPDKYGHIILRMGGFHIAMNFLGAVGHMMKGSGIEDIMVEAGICQTGTANKLLDGKDYYSMIHAHTVIENAVFSLLWESFETWVSEQDQDLEDFSLLSTHLDEVNKAVAEGEHVDISETCMKVLEKMRNRLDAFIKAIDSPTAKLWLMYLDMMQILNKFIAAERAGIWDLHIQATEEMLPYIVAAGHNKYTACLPHYLESMRNLPTSVESQFQRGNFTVRRQQGKFNGVWSDMALEQTYNKDAKTKLLQGISQRKDTIAKYLRALPSLTAVSEKTLHMAHMGDDQKRSDSSQSEKDRKLMQITKSVIEEAKVNPFSPSCDDLVNISSGQATQSKELVEAKQRGLDALGKAQECNVEKVVPVRLKTFVEKTTKKPKQAQVKELYTEERQVVRNLCFAENLGHNEKIDQFSHEWTKYPSSLFEPDTEHPTGFAMRKGNKSDYCTMLKTTMAEEWKEQTEPEPAASMKTVFFIDLMAFIQRYQDCGSTTFLELSAKYLHKIMTIKPEDCDVVHVVGDRYDMSPTKSLKMEERLRRQKKAQGSRIYIPHDNLKLPNWKLFMSNQQNKHNLEEYLCRSWSLNWQQIPSDCTLILGGLCQGAATKVTNAGATAMEGLICDEHEEADTRIFAHIAYSAQSEGCKRAVISANDTDVLLLPIYHVSRIDGLCELWLRKQDDTFIPCHWISVFLATHYTDHTTSSVLTTYALTGCDSVSYIFRCGKKRALKVTLECDESLKPLAEFGMPGSEIEISDDVKEASRKFICALYGKKNFSGSIDELRCHLFQTKKSDIRSLPPTSDAFDLHLRRALYQALVWKRASSESPMLPTATDFGRTVQDGALMACRMTKAPKPTLQTTKCNCQKGRCRSNCPCGKARPRVPCTLACRCCGDPRNCDNTSEIDQDYVDT